MTTLTIDWRGVFCEPGFRKGWLDQRNGGFTQDIADINPLYQIGRCAAIEAKGFELPDVTGYFSMQMRMLLEACPEMRREFVISGARFFASIKAKENIA